MFGADDPLEGEVVSGVQEEERRVAKSIGDFFERMNCAYQYPQAVHPQSGMNVHQAMPQQMHHQPADAEFLEVIWGQSRVRDVLAGRGLIFGSVVFYAQ